MTDKKKAAPLTNAERQARHRVKKKLARDALRRAFHLAQSALLLDRYKKALAIELKTNPQSRYAKQCAQQIQALNDRLTCTSA